HLPKFGLINMNGRMYDPVIGRMLSPDNYVQSPLNAQNYNRYSYCLNNPLKYTDPDGEWIHIVVGAVFGGIINVATNWKHLDSFGEGLASFGIGAATGALTAVNPFLGATVGGGFSSAGNDVIRQVNKDVGLNQVEWGSVGTQAFLGAFVGGATYGLSVGINVNGVSNNIMNGLGITNTSARNIVGSGINGVIVGSSSGVIRGIATGAMTGQWNIWEHTWKGALYGGVGGLAFGGLTELGYQAQLKWGQNKALNSKNTGVLAGQGEDYINRLRQVGVNDNIGDVIDGYSGPEIVVEYSTQTGASTVYIRNINPNNYWQPPAPYQYYSPTLYQNILRLHRLRL
ncbi:hypothetical protein LJC11_04820, partial [Bacteroidales bacterium OttesenSCG-928-I21]|nr:hypothetical protein [Bacteroidales bacterium OttesenSCG-928-I21]